MPPSGPRAITRPRQANSPSPVPEHPPFRGPVPGKITVSNQYTLEQNIRRLQTEHGCDPAREDSYRLQGVSLIDSVRHALHLPVKTFTTACTYYHMFRLCHRDVEYNLTDASLACLFVACKVEDTIKKSREILCAAYNLRTPEAQTTQDDKMFEGPHAVIIGLERHILETIGFDFRARYPQKTLIKLIRNLFDAETAKEFVPLAYAMSLDVYKTFAPIKASTSTLVLACLELTALMSCTGLEKIRALDPATYFTTRGAVVEVVLDLLDLYTQSAKHTRVGMKYELTRFIDVKIRVNEEVDANPSTLRRFTDWCDRCESESKYPLTPGSATSPAATNISNAPASGGGGSMKGLEVQTMRFVYDIEEARKEREIVDEFMKEEWEEYEIEVEEKISDPDTNGGSYRGNRDHPRHGGPSRGGQHDNGWGPYARDKGGRPPRGRRGGY